MTQRQKTAEIKSLRAYIRDGNEERKRLMRLSGYKLAVLVREGRLRPNRVEEIVSSIKRARASLKRMGA